MRSVCAWCKQELRKDSDNNVNVPITHGICYDCSMKLLEFGTIPIQDFLDNLSKSILLTDKDANVKGANTEAIIKLKKPFEYMKNFPCGEVMQCKHSELPERCGNTEHCPSCTIRNAVEKTFETGISVQDVKTFQYRRTEHGIEKIEMTISTEKFGKYILLQIQDTTELKSEI